MENKIMIDINTLTVFKMMYPKKGKLWCINTLGMTDGQVRHYATKYNLKSEYSFNLESNKKRGDYFRGKKRPEHSEYLKLNHPLKGKHRNEKTREKISNANKIAYKEGRLRADNFKGHKHTEESKLKISRAGLGRKFKKERTEKILKTKMERYGKLGFPTSNTYSHSKRGYYKIGGKKMYFRSLWEANYALYVDYLQKTGKIKKWEFEVDTFWFNNIKRGVRSYLPDFKITNNDESIEYHEIKGYMDAKSITKLKRMKKYYPNTKIVLIEGNTYKDLKNKMGAFLKFY